MAVYVGTLHENRLDVPLVAELAAAAPDVAFALVGPDSLATFSRATLQARSNVRLLGPKHHRNVPAYLQHADVVIVPHVVSAFTESLDPIKAYECLAVSTPVVATPVAGFREHKGLMHIASRESFGARLRDVLDSRPERGRNGEPSWEVRGRISKLLSFGHDPSRPRDDRKAGGLGPLILEVPSEVLEDMYRTNSALAASGSRISLQSVVVPEFANALYRLVRERKPELVLEVGMAHGATALAVATALSENRSGRLVSIDPFQSTDWQSAGLVALERAGLWDLHELVEQPDYSALPRLLDEWGRSIDVAYIDGLHSVEYVLLDFFYVDRLLKVGGVVGFNDCDWHAVMPTLRFVRNHRHYAPVDVGLAPAYGIRNGAARLYLRAEAKSPVRPSRLSPVARALGRRREDRYLKNSTRGSHLRVGCHAWCNDDPAGQLPQTIDAVRERAAKGSAHGGNH